MSAQPGGGFVSEQTRAPTSQVTLRQSFWEGGTPRAVKQSGMLKPPCLDLLELYSKRAACSSAHPQWGQISMTWKGVWGAGTESWVMTGQTGLPGWKWVVLLVPPE